MVFFCVTAVWAHCTLGYIGLTEEFIVGVYKRLFKCLEIMRCGIVLSTAPLNPRAKIVTRFKHVTAI